MSRLRTLTNEELRVLTAYAIEHGRLWKRDLRHAWETASEPGILQALRNSHGPTWLVGYRIGGVQ